MTLDKAMSMESAKANHFSLDSQNTKEVKKTQEVNSKS